MIVGGQPGTARDGVFWEAVLGLLDRVWPGIEARIALAGRWGASWAEQSHPFAYFEGDRAVAHVGVLRHALVLGGRRVEVAGVHAVCSDPEARGRGYVRRLLEAANAWIDERDLPAKLHTDFPDLYARVGYRTVPTYRFVLARQGGGGSARALGETEEDLALLHRHLGEGARLSDALDHAGDGALPLTNAALHKGNLSWFHHAPDLDAILLLDRAGDDLVLLGVAAPRMPPLDAILDAVPFPFARVVFAFTPDRVCPEALPEAIPPEAGVLQVRGAWPDALPIAVPAPWEH